MSPLAMRNLGIGLAGAVLFSLAALAGAVYTNDTGVIAYGFRIVFEAPVRITAHAPSLPDQNPQEEATEFTFTGGEVPPGGSFWLSWNPSGVAVLSIEWLTSSPGPTPRETPPAEAVSPAPTSPLSPNPHLRQETFPAILKSSDGQEVEVRITRRISQRMIPFLVEYEVEGGEGLTFTWDMDRYLDSDQDGLFRNDTDAVGKRARWIYPTNRTPYTVTLWAEDGEGRRYLWEDEVAFNVQNGGEVLLDAEAFLGDVTQASWEVFSGDPRDENFRISSPTRKQTTLVAEYPGVTHVVLGARDRAGNQHTYDTTLYVFNKNPELFKVRGVRTNFWLYPEQFGYLNLSLEYLKGMGFNWIKIPIYWLFSVNPNGSYKIYAPKVDDCIIHSNCDAVLEQVIQLLHEQGFRVELHLVIDPAPGTTIGRGDVPMNEKFFEGPEGYFAFVRHYIEVANRTGVEVFVGKTEMTCTEFYEARPWMDKLIEIMRNGLVSSEYTLENFIGQWATPAPWESRYGTDLNKLNLIEWSTYTEKWGYTNDSPISELGWIFRNKVLYVFTRTNRQFPHLRQVIGEVGVPSVDGGAKDFFADLNRPVDYEEQRRAAAAILRELYRYVEDGNDFFEGWFWHALTIARDADRILRRNDYDLWGKPAMEEFYVFYSSEPKMLPVVPYFNNIYSTRYYINELQDVHLIQRGDIEVIEGFEGSRNYREHLSAWKIFSIPHFATGRARIITSDAYEGNQSLEVTINNPYGRGADVAVSSRFPVGTWDDVEAVSIAIKRMDARLGAALLIPDGENLLISYAVRIPVSKVGEWEHFVIPVSDFVTLDTDGQYRGIQDTSSLNPWDIYVVFYPTTEEPLDTKVYIDSLGVLRTSPGTETNEGP